MDFFGDNLQSMNLYILTLESDVIHKTSWYRDKESWLWGSLFNVGRNSLLSTSLGCSFNGAWKDTVGGNVGLLSCILLLEGFTYIVGTVVSSYFIEEEQMVHQHETKPGTWESNAFEKLSVKLLTICEKCIQWKKAVTARAWSYKW